MLLGDANYTVQISKEMITLLCVELIPCRFSMKEIVDTFVIPAQI